MTIIKPDEDTKCDDDKEKRRSYVEVVVRYMSAFVLLLKMVQLCLESFWLVENADDDVQTGHYTEDVGDEFWGVRSVNLDSLEERFGVRRLGKDSKKKNGRSSRKSSHHACFFIRLAKYCS